jgi:hypothetical protein
MRIRKFEKYAKLLVYWDDITHEAAWRSVKDRDVEPIEVHTLGFYLGTKKRALRLASDLAADGDCDVKCIPWGVIKKVWEVEKIGN